MGDARAFWRFLRGRSASVSSDFNAFPALPEAVQLHVLSFLSLHELTDFALVCCYARQLVNSDCLWRPLYHARFPPKPGDDLHTAAMSSKEAFTHRWRYPIAGDEVQSLWVPRSLRAACSANRMGPQAGLLARHLSPSPVAMTACVCRWHGSFNLVSGDEVMGYEVRPPVT